MAEVKVFKSKVFVTPPVRAVFPHLNDTDQFGSYSVDVDVLQYPELEETINKQIEETIAAAQEKLKTNKVPTNAQVRTGEYKDEPFRRIAFKMKAERKVKDKPVSQKPRLVDAHRNPMSDLVFGGSLIRIAYFLQYTIVPTGTFMSVKLDSVQVLECVGPGGSVAVDVLFDEEDGFVSEGPTEEPESVPGGTESVETPASGSDF